MQFLGRSARGGVAIAFLRDGDTDLAIRVDRKGAPCAREGERVALSLVKLPDQPEAGRRAASRFEAVADRLLAREADLAAWLDEDAAPAGEPFVLGDGTAEVRTWRVPVPGGGTARVRLGPAGRFPARLLCWSTEVVPESGPLDASGLQAVTRFLLDRAADRLVDRETGGKTDSPPDDPRFVYLDLSRRFRRPELPPGPIVLTIEVPSACDNRCIYCDKPEMPQVPPAWPRLRRVLRAWDAGGGPRRMDVVLSGNDALNSPDLVPVLAGLRRRGNVSRIIAVSPATRMRDPQVASRLRAAGLDGVTMNLLGPDAASHDAMAGRDGAFDDLWRAFDNGRAAGLAMDLNHLVLAQNLGWLPATLGTVRSRGVRVRVYHFVADAYLRDDLWPRKLQWALGLTARFRDHAAVLAGCRDRVESTVASLHHVPLCVLPDWARLLAGHSSHKVPGHLDRLPAACRACSALGRTCPSVDVGYLDVHGDSELTAL